MLVLCGHFYSKIGQPSVRSIGGFREMCNSAAAVDIGERATTLLSSLSSNLYLNEMDTSVTNSTLGDATLQAKEDLLKPLTVLVDHVKHNLLDLASEWKLFQRDCDQTSVSGVQEPMAVVSKASLDALATEAMMLKEFLPKVLNPDYLSTYSQLSRIEQELRMVLDERDTLVTRCEHLQRRVEAVLSDYEQEKREKFDAKCEANSLSQQLSQQTDYCSSMGTSCCTLLWRVSQNEDSIHSILTGSKVSEFFELISGTLQSYLATYSGDMPVEESQETQFILALCGIVTNIAASPYGRDYLANSVEGRALIDILCSVLTMNPNGQPCVRMKGLVLMSLYNISINQKGLQYLTSREELMPILVWMLHDKVDCSENRLHCLKLLQSLILDLEGPKVIHQAMETIPMPLLQQLTSDVNLEIRETALELMSDLNTIQRHNETC